MTRPPSALLLLLLAGPAWAAGDAPAPPQLFGDAEVKVYRLATVRVQGVPQKAAVTWDVAAAPAIAFDAAGRPYILTPEPSVAPPDRNARAVTFTGPPGTYAVACTVTTFGPDGLPEAVKLLKTVTVSGLGPQPPPPGPTPPGPTPPGPTPPAPGARLIDGPPDGLQVLLVYPNNNPPAVGTEARAVLSGEEVRSYLDGRCVKDPATGTPERRVWADSQDPAGAPDRWRKAFDRVKGRAAAAPYFVISGPAGGSEGPVTTKAEFLAELRKWGGP